LAFSFALIGVWSVILMGVQRRAAEAQARIADPAAPLPHAVPPAGLRRDQAEPSP
jgi:hypothetical protein